MTIIYFHIKTSRYKELSVRKSFSKVMVRYVSSLFIGKVINNVINNSSIDRRSHWRCRRW